MLSFILGVCALNFVLGLFFGYFISHVVNLKKRELQAAYIKAQDDELNTIYRRSNFLMSACSKEHYEKAFQMYPDNNERAKASEAHAAYFGHHRKSFS
tara:strand:- start:1718 stop:2011 length:294 start_codon:yes stop_codon:yes gene_type:complete